MTVSWTLFPVREFRAHQGKWQEINLAGAPSPLLDPAFVMPLIDEFADGSELLAVYGGLQSPAAMTILRRVAWGKWETFQPSQAPVSMLVKRRSVAVQDVLRSLIGSLPGVPLVVGVSCLDPDLLPRPDDNGNITTLDFIHTARILINQPFEQYWARRDGKLRQETRRRLNRLNSMGIELRLDIIDDPQEITVAVEEFGRLESAGWKGKQGTAVHAENAQGRFYTSMLRAFCALGRGRVYRYWFGNRIASMQFCIEGHGTLAFLKTTYDEDFKTHGPGILMQRDIMERVFAENAIEKVEFYGRTGDLQARWCDNQIRTMYHINYYRWPWLANMQEVRLAFSRRPESIPRTAGDEQAERAASGVAPTAVRGATRAVTLYKDLSALPDRYEALFRLAGRASLFHTLPWYRNFVESGIVPKERLRIYGVDTAANAGPACAVLLMHDCDSGAGSFGARTLTGLSNYYSSLFGPVVEPDRPDVQETLDALAAAIARDETRWDMIDLHPLSAETPVYRGLIDAFRNAGLLVQTYFCFGNWYLQVRGRPYAEYFETLPSQLKNTIRSKKRQLETSARSKIVVCRDGAGLDQALSAYERAYAASWKVAEPYPEFIRGLCRACAESGWLRLGVVYVDDQPAAAQIWIVNAGVATIYKLAYDERYARLSAGSILTAHLMEHVLDVDKVHEVDYLTGDEPYKKDWMSDRRERWGIVAFNLRTPKGLLAASRHLGSRAARYAIDFVRHPGGTST